MRDGETENGIGSELQPADLLRDNEGGVVRIGRSRISLDLVVECYENGQTPEDIVRNYDTLPLADAYSAIGYYLRNREKTRAYLTQRAAEAKFCAVRLRRRILRFREPRWKDAGNIDPNFR